MVKDEDKVLTDEELEYVLACEKENPELFATFFAQPKWYYLNMYDEDGKLTHRILTRS